MTKLRRRPPAGSGVEDFISGAETQTNVDVKADSSLASVQEVTENLPWDAPGLRADVPKVYNLRLPEPYLIKLKYIAEHTPHSMQQFCLHVLLPAIDAKIEELTARRR